MLRYRINVLQALKEKGFTAYKLRKENIFGGAVVQAFRNGEIVSIHSLHTVCKLLNCQLSDIVEYIPDEEIHNEWEIAIKSWVRLPIYALKDERLTKSDTVILAMLIDIIDNDEEKEISIKRLANTSGISDRQVIRTVKKLTECNYIEKIRIGRTNLYKFKGNNVTEVKIEEAKYTLDIRNDKSKSSMFVREQRDKK